MQKVNDRMVFHLSKDKTVNNLMVKFSNRAIVSNKKHNNTIYKVERPIKEWVSEALDEAMDMCVYLQRLLEKIENEELNNG